jgi:exopolyphosphatase/guanosine-5'-triphosphate,3'-diphosphate pyrophosphatase
MERTEAAERAAAAPALPVLEERSTGDARRDVAATSLRGPIYAALDLGTNNCRLLIARQGPVASEVGGFRVLDSFCRIVRLGEGVASSGRLSEAAMARAIEAIKICGERMHMRHVSRSRLIATEACRVAANGEAFLARVVEETGLRLEIVSRETEAMLAATGCCSLADPEAQGVVLFDIGGGSSEIVWLGPDANPHARARREDEGVRQRIRAWESMQVGVVTLAETFGGRVVTATVFDAMVEHVQSLLKPFAAKVASEPRCGQFHLLGTSGTVTTIAGVYLDLARYDRRKVDGLWMTEAAVSATIAKLRSMSFGERAMNGCIGPDRADLVLAGCAILEAIRRVFPSERVRIADRGLREGILMQMMASDRIWSRDER